MKRRLDLAGKLFQRRVAFGQAVGGTVPPLGSVRLHYPNIGRGC